MWTCCCCAFQQGAKTVLAASNACWIRGRNRWSCVLVLPEWEKVGGEDETSASGPTRGPVFFDHGWMGDGSLQRHDWDGWGVTGERMVVAICGRPQPWVEGPRLHGSEVVPPWCVLCCYVEIMRGVWNWGEIFSNERPTVRQDLNYYLNNKSYLKWSNNLNMNIKVGGDSSKLLNWIDLFFQNLFRKNISHRSHS